MVTANQPGIAKYAVPAKKITQAQRHQVQGHAQDQDQGQGRRHEGPRPGHRQRRRHAGAGLHAQAALSPASARPRCSADRLKPDDRARRRRTLRRHLGGAAHLRRGREPRRHLRGHPRAPCPAPGCWWSTTPRPMAPASWPTAWPPRTPRIEVLHRAGKEGLGKAYIDGFAVALDGGATHIVQMDADWSHSPDYLPALMAAARGAAPTSSSARATRAVAAFATGASCGASSRAAARSSPRSCCACRPTTSPAASRPGAAPRSRPSSGIGSTRAATSSRSRRPTWPRAPAPRVAEVPIVFKDREVGTSKMSKSIIVEALMVVLQLRWEELRGRGPTARDGARRRRRLSAARRAACPDARSGLGWTAERPALAVNGADRGDRAPLSADAPQPGRLNITIVAANPFEFDSRFLRSATSLAADGHRLRILGWSAPGLPTAGGAGAGRAAHPPRHRPTHQQRPASRCRSASAAASAGSSASTTTRRSCRPMRPGASTACCTRSGARWR